MGHSAASSTVLTTSADGVVSVWLDRPTRRNALDGAAVDELGRALSRHDARVIVLGSTDQRCFCAGVDLTLGDGERAKVSDALYALYDQMLRAPLPIVAALSGPAIGGGAQLAIASDLRIAGPGAELRFVGAGHGLAVGAWGLPALVGRGRALDICLSMRSVGAREALALGLIDRIEPDPNSAALAVAAEIARLDRGAVGRIKRVATEATGLLAALERERTENRDGWSGSVAGLISGTGSAS